MKQQKSIGFDADTIDKQTKFPVLLNEMLNGDTSAMLKFNHMLVELHKKKQFNIVDSLVNIVSDFVDESILMKFLQPNVVGLLTSELAKKHGMFSITSTSAINKFIR